MSISLTANPTQSALGNLRDSECCRPIFVAADPYRNHCQRDIYRFEVRHALRTAVASSRDRSFLARQEGDDIAKLVITQLFIKALRHNRDAAGMDLVDLVTRNANLVSIRSSQ